MKWTEKLERKVCSEIIGWHVWGNELKRVIISDIPLSNNIPLSNKRSNNIPLIYEMEDDSGWTINNDINFEYEKSQSGYISQLKMISEKESEET